MQNVVLKIAGGQRVGEISGDRAIIFVTSKHYLGMAHGYSIDGEVLRTIVSAGVPWIVFRNVKSGKAFRISVEVFQSNAKPYDFGYGQKWAASDSLYRADGQTMANRHLYA